MSDSTSPAPRLMTTAPQPQQLTENSLDSLSSPFALQQSLPPPPPSAFPSAHPGTIFAAPSSQFPTFQPMTTFGPRTSSPMPASELLMAATFQPQSAATMPPSSRPMSANTLPPSSSSAMAASPPRGVASNRLPPTSGAAVPGIPIYDPFYDSDSYNGSHGPTSNSMQNPGAPQAPEHAYEYGNEQTETEPNQPGLPRGSGNFFGDGLINAGHVESHSSEGTWYCCSSIFSCFSMSRHAGANAGKAVYDGTDWVQDQAFEQGNVNMQWLVGGLFGAIMLVIIPIWDGISLLHDPTWVYLHGVSLPIFLILVAAVMPILFLITVACLLNYGRRVARQEQTFLNVTMLFALLLGAFLAGLSTSIDSSARWGTHAFISQCEENPLTRTLFNSYQDLQKLRNNASCSHKSSVEQCSGYKQSPENDVIKGMEESMQCAGFCFYPKVKGNSSSKKSSTNATVSNLTGYPPALFSQAPLRGSCSAMAGRDMESFVTDIGYQLQWEGYLLIGISILQGFILLADVHNKEKKLYSTDDPEERKGYGTMSLRNEAKMAGADATGPTPHHSMWHPRPRMMPSMGPMPHHSQVPSMGQIPFTGHGSSMGTVPGMPTVLPSMRPPMPSM